MNYKESWYKLKSYVNQTEKGLKNQKNEYLEIAKIRDLMLQMEDKDESEEYIDPETYRGMNVFIDEDRSEEYPYSIRLIENNYELDAFGTYQDAVYFCNSYGLVII